MEDSSPESSTDSTGSGCSDGETESAFDFVGPEEKFTVLPSTWMPAYLRAVGLSKSSFMHGQRLRIWGCVEGTGITSYLMSNFFRFTGIESDVLFSNEVDERVRRFALSHGRFQHFYGDVCSRDDDQHCFVCGHVHDQFQDCGVDTDLALMGVPCQLFSKLNTKSKEKGYNPFLEPGFDTVKSCLRKLRILNPRSFVIEEVTDILKELPSEPGGKWEKYKAILTGQGFDVKDFNFDGCDASLITKLAGNAMTTPVVGAVVLAMLLYALPIGHNNQPMLPVQQSDSESSSSESSQSSDSNATLVLDPMPVPYKRRKLGNSEVMFGIYK